MRRHFIDCTIQRDHGAVEAYVCGRDDENWLNYLDEMGMRSAMIDAIAAAPVARVAVLRDIDVDEDARGKGLGTSLMNDIMAAFEQQGAEVVLIFADMQVTNEFDLVRWYRNWGFESVDRDELSPCMMIGPEGLIAEVRQINGLEATAEAAPSASS